MVLDCAIALELAKVNPTSKAGHIRVEKRHVYVAIWLLFMNGIRIVEAGVLQWKNLDLKTGQLTNLVSLQKV